LQVLIADDEPLVAEGLRARLGAEGHEVIGVAYDGVEAVALAEVLRPDLILLDIRMPKLDGITAAERIMAARPVPIIIVTAHYEEALIQRAIAAGVMAYLVKPVHHHDLLPAMALATTRFRDIMGTKRPATEPG
jgi:response regulator NasT